jgi:prepilin-type N-terminal cleavage/methylation domain-containing protein
MKKNAFSLIELLIVVLIMGLVYTLGITKIQKVTDPTSNLSLKSLKKYLQKIPHKDKVLFLCTDSCRSCRVIVDDTEDSNITTIDDFLDDSVRVYRYDFFDGMQEREKRVFFNSENVEKSVCFSYEIDSEGIGDQIYVEYKNFVYDFTPYDSVVRYNSIDDAQEKIEQIKQEVQR